MKKLRKQFSHMRKQFSHMPKWEKIFYCVLFFSIILVIAMPLLSFVLSLVWGHQQENEYVLLSGIVGVFWRFGWWCLIAVFGFMLLGVLVVTIRKSFIEEGYFIFHLMRIISVICFVLGYLIFNSNIEEPFLDIDILSFAQNFSMRHILMIIFVLFGIVIWNIKIKLVKVSEEGTYFQQFLSLFRTSK